MVRVPVCSDVGGLWQYVTTDALPALNFFRLLLLNKISCLRGFSNHNNLLYPRQYVRLSNLKWICMLYLSSSSTETVFPPFLHKGSVMFQGCDKSVRCVFKYYRKGSRWRIWFQLLASVMNMYTHTHTLPSTKTVSWCQIRDSPPPSLFPTPITFRAIARHKSRNARRVETRARGVGGFAGWEKWEICEEDQCVIIVFYVPPCDRSLTMGKVC